MGSAINTIGLSLCVLKFDNPVLGMGTLSLLLTIPWIIFGPIAGVFADRYSKKQTIIVCDIIRGLLSLELFFTQDIVLFYLIVFLMTIFDVIFSPAISGFLPFVVEKDELESANSIYSGSGQLAYLIGPAIGGILVAVFGGFPILCSNYIVNELGASDQVYGIFMSIKSICYFYWELFRNSKFNDYVCSCNNFYKFNWFTNNEKIEVE
jgi:MFS family permease